jgi:hypothetical protein
VRVIDRRQKFVGSFCQAELSFNDIQSEEGRYGCGAQQAARSPLVWPQVSTLTAYLHLCLKSALIETVNSQLIRLHR